ncbi:symporter small accessory protein [Anoxybacterium hadale]
MLGLSDPSILLAYLLSIGGAILCISYGVINWNKDGSSNGGDKK